jgi:hypothetical protein
MKKQVAKKLRELAEHIPPVVMFEPKKVVKTGCLMLFTRHFRRVVLPNFEWRNILRYCLRGYLALYQYIAA